MFPRINLKGNASDTKNVVTALIYFCNYPYETPCMSTYINSTIAGRSYIKYAKNKLEKIHLLLCKNIITRELDQADFDFWKLYLFKATTND